MRREKCYIDIVISKIKTKNKFKNSKIILASMYGQVDKQTF